MPNRKNSKGERMSIMNHAHDARERGVLEWVSNSDFNKDENHIYFDFETVPTGVKDAKGKYAVGHYTSEPYEIGLTVRTSTGERISRSFMFTPVGINSHASNPKPGGFEKGSIFHKEAMRFHITDDHGKENLPKKKEGEPDGRREHLERVLQPYTTGTGDNVNVPWIEINNFLFGNAVGQCGLDPNKITNFGAHNGGFDFPLLERLLVHGGKKAEEFTNLYNTVNDTGKLRWSEHGWWGGWLNDKHRRRSDKSKGGGGHRHDTMLELSRLFGDANEGDNNPQRFVLRKAKNSGKSGAGYYRTFIPIGYAAGQEYQGARGASSATGCSVDDFRASIQHCAFDENANNPVKATFEELKLALESGETHRLLQIEGGEKDGLKGAINKELEHPQYKAKTAKDYYRAYNAVSAHGGAGDTAFVTEVMYPFLESMINLFDHDKYHPFDDDGEFIKGRGDEFASAFQQEQDNWGGMLGGYPKKSDRNATYDTPKLRFKAKGAGSGHPLLDGIMNSLNNAGDEGNKGKWFDADGNKRNALLDPIGQQSSMDVSSGSTGTKPKRATASDSGDPILTSLVQDKKMPNANDFPDKLKPYITGPITARKWEGSDNRGPRIVISVPVGNSRVTFSESYWDSDGDTDEVTYKPLLGAAVVGTGTTVDAKGVRDYLQQIFVGYNGARAPQQNIGMAIQRVLKEKHDVITAEMSDAAILSHAELNDFINTPASAWLSESLRGNPTTNEDIRALGMPVQDNDTSGRKTYGKYTDQIHELHRQLRESDDPLASVKRQMLFGAPHLVGQLKQFSEQFDPEDTFNRFVESNQLDPALYTLNMEGDPTAPVFTPTAEGGQEVNMARLVSTFLSGNEATDQAGNLVEGLHPQQFLHPEYAGSQGGLLSAFYNYLEFSHRISQGEEIGAVFDDQIGRPPREPHATENEASQQVQQNIFDDPDTSTDDQSVAADNIVTGAGSREVPKEVLDKASDDTKRRRENRKRFDDVRRDSTNAEDFQANLTALLDELGINEASPFVIDNHINSIRGQDSLDAAHAALFPTRETAQTLDGVQGLIDAAVGLYGKDSDKRNATNLVRELEWIRTNHPSVFTHEAMGEALNSLDSESVQGQYLDVMNEAYKAMGELAGEKLSLIQEEQTQMGDRFMSNSHRQFLFNRHSDYHEDNWYEVDDSTPIQEHFNDAPDPKEGEGRSIRDIARGMAVATAKQPLEALKYYTNWNALSEQYRDAASGRTQAGKKLMAAVKRGEKFREVNIGTPDEPEYATTEREYDYYIRNLPAAKDKQPSLLRQFLQGRKTFGDIEAENEANMNSAYDPTQSESYRTRSSMAEQRKWEQQEILNRSAFATSEITPEQQEWGVTANENFTGRRQEYDEDVRGAIEQVRGGKFEGAPSPPVDPNNNIVIGGVNRPDLLDPDTPDVAKSLDELREYLSRV